MYCGFDAYCSGMKNFVCCVFFQLGVSANFSVIFYLTLRGKKTFPLFHTSTHTVEESSVVGLFCFIKKDDDHKQ
jgi:hypothetical protein